MGNLSTVLMDFWVFKRTLEKAENMDIYLKSLDF